LRIAIASDEAFCFLYAENLEIFELLGCEIIFFSPINDAALPANSCGLYLCGGYPELYETELTDNKSMCGSIKSAIAAGLPTIAECGGFMYLHYIEVIHGTISKRGKLQRFGYCEITAKKDNLLCKTGESIRSHEFHYYDSSNCGDDFRAVKPVRGTEWDCVHASETLWAGFPHLFFPANPVFAENFVIAARKYKSSRTDIQQTGDHSCI